MGNGQKEATARCVAQANKLKRRGGKLLEVRFTVIYETGAIMYAT